MWFLIIGVGAGAFEKNSNKSAIIWEIWKYLGKPDVYFPDLLHLIENTFDQKRIYANPSAYPNPNSNLKTNPNSNLNPKAQLRFRTDEMTSFFDQV